MKRIFVGVIVVFFFQLTTSADLLLDQTAMEQIDAHYKKGIELFRNGKFLKGLPAHTHVLKVENFKAFGNKQFKDVGFKQLSQDIFLKEGNPHKGTIRAKNSGGNQGMNMRIPVQKISRCSPPRRTMM